MTQRSPALAHLPLSKALYQLGQCEVPRGAPRQFYRGVCQVEILGQLEKPTTGYRAARIANPPTTVDY